MTVNTPASMPMEAAMEITCTEGNTVYDGSYSRLETSVLELTSYYLRIPGTTDTLYVHVSMSFYAASYICVEQSAVVVRAKACSS